MSGAERELLLKIPNILAGAGEELLLPNIAGSGEELLFENWRERETTTYQNIVGTGEDV